MSQNGAIQLGLCCLNITMREKKTPVFSSRSIQLKTFETKGIEFLLIFLNSSIFLKRKNYTKFKGYSSIDGLE